MGRFTKRPEDTYSNPGMEVEKDENEKEVEKKEDKAFYAQNAERHANERAARSKDKEKAEEAKKKLPEKKETESDKIVAEDTKPENVQARVTESQTQMEKPDEFMADKEQVMNEKETTILDDPEVQKTDEGQVAQDAIDSKDISKVENIVTPDTGEPVVKPIYDANGRVTSFEQLVPENAELYSKNVAIGLTVLSAVMFALSGGRFPPINFIDLRWDDAKNKEAEMKNELARLYNEGVAPTIATEKRLESAYNNPELYNRETTDAASRGAASAQGNVALEQTAMNAELAKQLKGMDIENSQTLAKMSNEQQIALAKLMYDQNVKRAVNEYVAAKDAGVSTDEIAKIRRAYQGVTSVQKAFDYIEQAAGAVGNVAGAVGKAVGAATGTGNSDKNIKTFDAKKPNSSMLKKAFKWR